MDNLTVFKSFSNETALDLGVMIIKIAQERQWCIAVDIRRLNQQIFCYLSNGLSEDKNQWLIRKGNVARRFGASSKAISEKLDKEHTTLYEKYGLAHGDYAAIAGAVPLFHKDIGLIATIAVTGLKPEEDHQLIIDALERYRNEVENEI